MHLLSPWSLLWLPPIWGAIILLYILKLRRKDVEVSSLYLWQQVIRDVQANAPFQKLRYNPLLLVQLLIALLLVLALSQPVLRLLARGGRTLVLVVDTGVTMQATDGSPTRIDEAKQVAYRLVGQMHPGDRMILLAAGSSPQALTGFTDNRTELRRAIGNLQATEAPSDMHTALQLASELAQTTGNGGLIELVTDGCFSRTDTASLNLGNNVGLRAYTVGKSDDNVGIVAFDYRRLVGYQHGLEVLASTQNFSSRPRKFIEELYAGKQLVDAREVSLAPGASHTDTYAMQEPEGPLPLKFHLDVKDDLSSDDTAYLVLAPKRLFRVLLTGQENLFLENALEVDPDLQVDVAPNYPGDVTARKYDVVIFYNTAPKTLPPGHYLFIHCSGDRSPAQLTGATASMETVDWQHTDPVMRYVDLTNQRFDDVLLSTPKPWAREVVTGDSGPLIVAGEDGPSRSLFFAFDPDQSRLPLSVAFPILVSESVRWLATGEATEGLPSRAGQPVTLAAAPGVSAVSVRLPNGSVKKVPLAPDGRALFNDTDQCGFYSVIGGYPVGTGGRSGNDRGLFAISLNNAEASNIAPVKKLPFETPNPQAERGRPVVVFHPFLPWLVLLALIALGFEWYLFHRRPFFVRG
jgi:Ca-activated chloride channel family protein